MDDNNGTLLVQYCHRNSVTAHRIILFSCFISIFFFIDENITHIDIYNKMQTSIYYYNRIMDNDMLILST